MPCFATHTHTDTHSASMSFIGQQFDSIQLKSINLSSTHTQTEVVWWIITIYCAPNNLNAIFPLCSHCVRACVINVRHSSVTLFNAFKNCAPSTQKSHYSWSRLITNACTPIPANTSATISPNLQQSQGLKLLWAWYMYVCTDFMYINLKFLYFYHDLSLYAIHFLLATVLHKFEWLGEIVLKLHWHKNGKKINQINLVELLSCS